MAINRGGPNDYERLMHVACVQTDLRASLDDDSVRALMSVRMNIPRLLSISAPLKEEEVE